MNITIIVLTFNEEIHLKQLLNNIIDWAEYVYVLDSYSSDNTIKLAEEMGATVFLRKFDNYVNQRSYSLKQLPIKTEWVFILDADELLTDELKNEIEIVLKNNEEDIDAYFVRRKFYWQNQWLKYGGMFSNWSPRLVRHKKVNYNSRLMNEHLEILGKTAHLKNAFLHIDLKSFSDWISKHNKYSSLEAQEQLKAKINFEKDTLSNLSGSSVERKRWIREKIWNRMFPPLIRPFLYFIYVYIIRLGFLDGKAGFIYHVLHGFSYRFMIEAKYLALKNKKSESIN